MGILSQVFTQTYTIEISEKEEYEYDIVSKIREICGPFVYIRNFQHRDRKFVIYLVKGSQEDMILKLAFGNRLENY